MKGRFSHDNMLVCKQIEMEQEWERNMTWEQHAQKDGAVEWNK